MQRPRGYRLALGWGREPVAPLFRGLAPSWIEEGEGLLRRMDRCHFRWEGALSGELVCVHLLQTEPPTPPGISVCGVILIPLSDGELSQPHPSVAHDSLGTLEALCGGPWAPDSAGPGCKGSALLRGSRVRRGYASRPGKPRAPLHGSGVAGPVPTSPPPPPPGPGSKRSHLTSSSLSPPPPQVRTAAAPGSALRRRPRCEPTWPRGRWAVGVQTWDPGSPSSRMNQGPCGFQEESGRDRRYCHGKPELSS